MKGSRGVGTEIVWEIGALAGKGVGEEEEALTKDMVAEVSTEAVGVAEVVEVVEEGLTEDEEDVEVLTGEEEDEEDVGEAEAGVEMEGATLVRTGPVHHVASAIGPGTGSASSVKHPNLRMLVRMPTLHHSGKTVVANLAQGIQRSPL